MSAFGPPQVRSAVEHGPERGRVDLVERGVEEPVERDHPARRRDRVHLHQRLPNLVHGDRERGDHEIERRTQVTGRVDVLPSFPDGADVSDPVPREVILEDGDHALRGLDRHDLADQGRHRERERARPGADIEDARRWCQRQARDRLGHARRVLVARRRVVPSGVLLLAPDVPAVVVRSATTGAAAARSARPRASRSRPRGSRSRSWLVVGARTTYAFPCFTAGLRWRPLVDNGRDSSNLNLHRSTAEYFYMCTASTGRGSFMAGEEMIRIAVTELERLISTKNVVGEPVAMGDRVMIPISGYGFGFGGGSGKGTAGEGQASPRRRRGFGRRRSSGRHPDRGRGPGRNGLRPHGRAGPSPEEAVRAGRGGLDALVLARAPGDRRPQVQAGRVRHRVRRGGGLRALLLGVLEHGLIADPPPPLLSRTCRCC